MSRRAVTFSTVDPKSVDDRPTSAIRPANVGSEESEPCSFRYPTAASPEMRARGWNSTLVIALHDSVSRLLEDPKRSWRVSPIRLRIVNGVTAYCIAALAARVVWLRLLARALPTRSSRANSMNDSFAAISTDSLGKAAR